MPVNGFSVGKDHSLNITSAAGTPLIFSLITDFSAKPDLKDHKIMGMDGLVRHLRFHEGWSGGFSIDRQDNQLDDYWAQLEANYFQGLSEQTITITQTVQEQSGTLTQYRFTGVLLKLDSSGHWKGDDSVKQMVSFVASRRYKVS